MVNPRESYPEQMSYQLQGGGAVGDAVAAARGFGEAHQLAKADIARLCIVVEELVANLYDHGGQPDVDPIELRLSSDPGAIRIVIADTAAPFDLREPRPGGIPSSRGAGAGLDLIRAWAEVVDYDVTDLGNRLELLLPLTDRR
jgi:anti-sigma regulatory factor (Ser/Thr protein kinase)